MLTYLTFFPFEKPQSPCRTHFSHSTLDSQCTGETQPRGKTSMWKSQLNSSHLRSESCSVHLHNHMFSILYNLFWISSFYCRCYFCLHHDQIPGHDAEFPAGCLALKQPVSSLLPPAWWLVVSRTLWGQIFWEAPHAAWIRSSTFNRRRVLLCGWMVERHPHSHTWLGHFLPQGDPPRLDVCISPGQTRIFIPHIYVRLKSVDVTWAWSRRKKMEIEPKMYRKLVVGKTRSYPDQNKTWLGLLWLDIQKTHLYIVKEEKVGFSQFCVLFRKILIWKTNCSKLYVISGLFFPSQF